ncbi:hypothetical protein D3Z36_15450 [Lachnospiraceae bacterium]|nr:hypothetical protein [Lachnospiraceae bacterium]
MKEDKIPKVFISYSWSSDGITMPLAERLVSHGVDVVLDKWDLKEGQDKYVFMEQCVNNPEIDKVLIVCDKKYADKANNREGGVGDETAIISTEIYGKVNQEKFIPIIAECDEEGNPYVPTYIKTRIYVNLSDVTKYEEEYEKLLRNIYEKPLFKKPKLGLKPEWIEEDCVNLFPLQDLVRQLKGSDSVRKQNVIIRRFIDQYIEVLKSYYNKDINDGQQVYETWMTTKNVRDYFLDFLDALLETECDIGSLLCEVFEELYNILTCVKTFNDKANSYGDKECDVFKTHIWELFICAVTFLRHYEDYKSLNTILSNTYFLIDSGFGGSKKPTNYARFRHYSRPIEEYYKPESEKKDLLTLMGNALCCEREKYPIYTKGTMAQADLFLYQVFNGFDLVSESTAHMDNYWFPTCYVYAEGEMLGWDRMKSQKFCEKMCVLFGVTDIEELKSIMAKCMYDQEMHYRGSFNSAPAILNYIKIEDIGSMK